ncbi:linoleate 13S-lipoxygenase 3-1, chloroplastic-like protein [Tanacetum coccineum]
MRHKLHETDSSYSRLKPDSDAHDYDAKGEYAKELAKSPLPVLIDGKSFSKDKNSNERLPTIGLVVAGFQIKVYRLLGVQKIPYPRRCRTGRAPSDTDISAESRVEKPFPLYVPRDEQFDDEGVLLKLRLHDDLIKKLRLPNLVTRLHESSQGGGLLKHDTPKILSKNRFSWLRDDEFARQALAGSTSSA